MNLADLHLHTTSSDGTDSPEELLIKVQNANIKTFAITDHDNIKGAMKLRGVPGFILGIEFSCRYNGHKMHILGLNVNPENKYFLEALNTGEELRHKKFFKRIDFLDKNFGIKFSDSEIENLLKIPGLGKPHLAKLLIQKNYAVDKNDAVKNFLNKCKTDTEELDSTFVINAILKSGGVSVWAHPLGGEDESDLPREEFESELHKLISHGLQALECYYSKYDMKTCEHLAETARKNNLLISGGSDYHGTNKKVPLGRLNSEDIEISDELLSILNFFKGGWLTAKNNL